MSPVESDHSILMSRQDREISSLEDFSRGKKMKKPVRSQPMYNIQEQRNLEKG